MWFLVDGHSWKQCLQLQSSPAEELKDMEEGRSFPNGPLVETWRAALVSWGGGEVSEGELE